jgi:thiamine biosynthesis protein ThiS
MESIVMDNARPHAMRILLNGDVRDIEPDTTVKSLLDSLGLDARIVAVEVNRAVIKRERYPTTRIPEGAEVEVVAFVGGGGQVTTGDDRSRRVTTVATGGDW